MGKDRDRDFTDMLTSLDDGKVHFTLSKSLRELIKTVGETQKAGSLTLTIKAKADGRMVILTADSRTKIPQPATNSTFFYVDENGDLSRDDPKQPELKNLDTKPPTQLRTVPGTITTPNKEGA